MDAQSEKTEVFNKELENKKNNQTEVKNTITEMKNALEGLNGRLNDTEERISELEERVMEIIDVEHTHTHKNEKIWGQFKRLLKQHKAH